MNIKIILTPSDIARFWSYIPDRTDGCWLWTSVPNQNGYGRFSFGGVGGHNVLAHRVSYFIHYGEIPDGLFVCHKCDVRLCVNPEHLFIGTQKDNLRDAIAKGRLKMGRDHGSNVRPETVPRGVNHWSAKLTEEQVRAIRSEYVPRKVTCAKLAAKYGINNAHVSHIVRGKSWKHLL